MRFLFLFISLFFTPALLNAQQIWGSGDSQVPIYWVHSEGTVGNSKQFKRLELGLVLDEETQQLVDQFIQTGAGINPFDPSQIDIQFLFTRPDGITVKRFAFYFQDFSVALQGNFDRPETYKNEYVPKETEVPWRVRLAPDQLGQWKTALQIKVNGEVVLQASVGSFMCIPSEHKGYLEVVEQGGEKQPYLRFSSSEEPFFAVGINIPNAGELGCFPSQVNRWAKGIQELSRYGGNFTRLEVGGQTGLPDWENPTNYFSKLDDLFAFDQIVQTCEQNNVYAVLFRHHVEAMVRDDWAQVSWNKNPYNTQLKASPEDYFTQEACLKLQKNSLRYFFSRFCYSPNMAFYGFSEIEAWYTLLEKDDSDNRQSDGGKYSSEQANVLLNTWIDNQQQFIRHELNPNMKFLNTYASQNSVPKNPKGDANRLSDVVGLHLYSATKKANFEKRFPAVQEAISKYKCPVFIEESGLDNNFLLILCCTDIEFHNNLWSSAFMGTFSVGLDYWWTNGIFDKNYHHGFSELHRFFFGENLLEKNYIPQKWSDSRSWKKRKLETYYLVSSDGSSGLGWVHNAAIYWRNMTLINPCLDNVIRENTQANPPCICSKDPYGSSQNPYAPLRSGTDLYKHENTKGFNYDKIPDNFTDQPVSEIEIKDSLENPEVKLRGFKRSPWGRQKHWYKVVFYATRANGGQMQLDQLTLRIASSNNGNLAFSVPNLTFDVPDFAYKIEYLGQGISAEKAEIRTR